ncbi:hypothetical protein R3I93_006717 [Phoxinus phoxinus]|uniref:Uncharacterized protein n=1 Tax=Phoxinus phoxinus TaxID=58324 RepID=A0AAN9D6Y1_9TELE
MQQNSIQVLCCPGQHILQQTHHDCCYTVCCTLSATVETKSGITLMEGTLYDFQRIRVIDMQITVNVTPALKSFSSLAASMTSFSSLAASMTSFSSLAASMTSFSSLAASMTSFSSLAGSMTSIWCLAAVWTVLCLKILGYRAVGCLFF